MQSDLGSLGITSSDTPQDPSETNSPTVTNLDLTGTEPSDHSIVSNEASTFGKRDMDKYEALISAKASEDPEDHSITYSIFDRHGRSMRAAMKAPLFTATFKEGTLNPNIEGDPEKVSAFVERLIADPEFIEQYPEMAKMLIQVKDSATGEGLTVTDSVQPQVAAQPSIEDTIKSDILDSRDFEPDNSTGNHVTPVQSSPNSQTQEPLSETTPQTESITAEQPTTIPRYNENTANAADLLSESLDTWGFTPTSETVAASTEVAATDETQEQSRGAESSMTDTQMQNIPFEISRLAGNSVAMDYENSRTFEQEGITGQVLPTKTTEVLGRTEQLEPAVNIRVLPYEPIADILDTGAPETFIFSSENNMELFRITVSQDRPIDATNIDTRVRDIKIETETGQEATTARVLKRLTENTNLFALAPNLHRLLADPSHKLYSQINVFNLDGQEVYPRSIKNSEFIVGTEDEIEYRTEDFNRDIGESRTTKLTSQPFRQMYSGILNELKAIADEQLPEGIIRNSSGIHCDFRRHGVETIHEGNRETRQDILTFYRNGEFVTLRIAAIQNRQGGQATNARISLESSTSKDPSLPYMYNLIGTLLRDITFTRSHPTLVNLLNAFDERRQKERSESQKNNPNARRRSDWI